MSTHETRFLENRCKSVNFTTNFCVKESTLNCIIAADAQHIPIYIAGFIEMHVGTGWRSEQWTTLSGKATGSILWL